MRPLPPASFVLLGCVLGCGEAFDASSSAGVGGTGAGAAAVTSVGGSGGMGSSTSSTTSAGGSASSTGAGGTGGGTSPCPGNPLGTFSDDFGDAGVDDDWSAFPVNANPQTSGEVRWTIVGEYQGLTSKQNYSLLECSITLEVAKAPESGVSAYGFVDFNLPGDLDGLEGPDNRIAITAAGGVISYRVNENGTIKGSSSEPYTPSQHRVWRIRESGGTTYFEVSPDGVTFATRMQVATPGFASDGRIGIGCGPFQGTANADGAYRVDNFNL